MRNIFSKLALVFLTIVIFLVLIMLCSFLIESVLLPADYLFYENSPLCACLLAPLLIIPSLLLSYYVIYRLMGTDDYLDIVWWGRKLGKWKIAFVAVWLFVMYACFTDLTYVTNDRIVVVTPFDLKGQAYSYCDVQQIKTGFGNKKLSLFEHEKEGSFYYKIVLDGDETVFHMPSVNPDIGRYEDTYLEIEEFDQALRKYPISRESSAEGYDKCTYDQQYVDRFLRIIGPN